MKTTKTKQINLMYSTKEMMRIASWFKRRALENKEHPVVLWKNSTALKEGNVQPELLTAEFIYHMVLETAEIAFANHMVTHIENEIQSAFACEYWQSNMRNYAGYYHPAQVLTLLRNEEMKKLNKVRADFIDNWKRLVPKGYKCMKCNFCGTSNVISELQFSEIYVKGKLDWKCIGCKNIVHKHEDMEKVNSMKESLAQTSPLPVVKPTHHKNPKSTPYKKLVRKVNGIPIYSSPGKNNKTKYFIFSYRSTEFIRWLGQKLFTFSETIKILKKLKITVSEDTIKTQLSTGKTNSDRFGPIPNLSKVESKAIYTLIRKNK